MKTIAALLFCLEKTPIILDQLLVQIPEHRIRKRRKEEKWSVHEQICHLVEAQGILIARFKQFEEEDKPIIKTYDPGPGRADDHYQKLDMDEELKKFISIRGEMLEWLGDMPESYWDKQGTHNAFEPYSARILLGHTLNVDYAHLFSIEQLGLTREGFENEIITIP